MVPKVGPMLQRRRERPFRTNVAGLEVQGVRQQPGSPVYLVAEIGRAGVRRPAFGMVSRTGSGPLSLARVQSAARADGGRAVLGLLALPQKALRRPRA